MPRKLQRIPIRKLMRSCRICPRNCGVNRLAGETGYCGMDAEIRVAHTQLHMWEEPCISGKEGSGTVFFAGCNLRCVFCQNAAINGSAAPGRKMTVRELADVMLDLQRQGAANINLVTAAHYLPQTAAAIGAAKEAGLRIPVVYNSSGYEKAAALRLLEGLVDVYLPDFKYMDPDPALHWSGAEDYPETAKAAVAEMVRQVPVPEFDGRGMMKKGVIVRHLLLPGHVGNAKRAVSWLLESCGNSIYISLMNQYTPMPAVGEDPLLKRRVTKREYEKLIDFALSAGLVNGFFQEGETARESFIPPFPAAEEQG